MGRRGFDHAAIFVAALTVRLAHAAFVAQTPFFEGLVIDARTYDGLARSIAEGNGFGGPFYQPPLYPAVIAGLYRLGLDGAWAITVVQAICGGLVAALAVEIGRRIATRGDAHHIRRTGVVTGLLVAFWGPLIVFDVERLPPAFVDLAFLLGWALAHARRRTSAIDALVGLSLGVATTGWALVAVALPACAWLRARRSIGPRRYAVVVTMVAAFAIPVGVVWAHNASAGAPNVIVSWNGGINLWLGNNRDWRRTWAARPGAAFEPELERPDREGVTEPGARSAYFVDLVLRDAGDRPADAVGRTLEKLYYVFHGREIRRNQDLALIREASPVAAVTFWELGVFFPFGLFAPLSFIAFYRRRREPAARAAIGSTVLYAVALSLFFVAARYRLPLVLVMLPFAADELCRWLFVTRPSRRTLVTAVILLAGLNLPNGFTASLAADGADRGRLRAEALMATGDAREALAVARRALDEHPDDANLLVMVADFEARRGGCADAVGLLHRATERAPRASTPWVLLGRCTHRLGDLDEAERTYARALALHPFHAEALKGAALVYMARGDATGAIAMLRRFTDAGYDDPGVKYDLGRLLLDVGRPAEALEVLEPLLADSPEDRELEALVDRARAAAGR